MLGHTSDLHIYIHSVTVDLIGQMLPPRGRRQVTFCFSVSVFSGVAVLCSGNWFGSADQQVSDQVRRPCHAR